MPQRRGDKSIENEVTAILRRVDRGDHDAINALFPIVYDELRGIAAAQMRDERAGHTLQPTALVNEAYLKLVDQTKMELNGRAHFLAVAARQMRQILVDHARGRARLKRGGNRKRIDLHDADAHGQHPLSDILALDEALREFAELDEEKARVVELRYFGGMTHPEIAEALGVSRRTVDRAWDLAKRWLAAQLQGDV